MGVPLYSPLTGTEGSIGCGDCEGAGAESKDVGFPDLLATGEVDLPAARSGEPGRSGFAVCFVMLWHGLKACSALLTIRGAHPWCCDLQVEKWAAANQRAADILAQVGSSWFPAVALITYSEAVVC